MPRPCAGDTYPMRDGRIARIFRSEDVPDGVLRLHTTSGANWDDFRAGYLREEHFTTENYWDDEMAIVINASFTVAPQVDPNKEAVW